MLAERLRKLRQANKLTQENLAKELHVTGCTIALWESARRQPNIEMLCKIAKFFNVSVDYLIGMDCDLTDDFKVQIIGNISKEAYNEIMDFVSFVKYKNGYLNK